jgi:hypothetical protein
MEQPKYASFALEDLGEPSRLSSMSWEEVIENYKHPTDDEDIVKRDNIFSDTVRLTVRSTPDFFFFYLKFMAQQNRLSRHVTLKLGLRQGLSILASDESMKALAQYEEIIANEFLIKGYATNNQLLRTNPSWNWKHGYPSQTSISIPRVYHSALHDYSQLLGVPVSSLAILACCMSFSTGSMTPHYESIMRAEVAQFRRAIEDKLSVFKRRYSPPDLTA